MLRTALTATAVALSAVVLAGCTHGVQLQPLDGGMQGVGDSSLRGRSLSVRIGGKHYRGDFGPVADAEVQHVDTTNPAFGPVTAGRYWGSQGKTGGTAVVMEAKDGSTIACKLDWDAPAHLGNGLCRGDDGANYSLRIY